MFKERWSGPIIYIAETLINSLFTDVAFHRDSEGDGSGHYEGHYESGGSSARLLLTHFMFRY